MRPGRDREARPRPPADPPSECLLTLREWEDQLDWLENQQRPMPVGWFARFLSLGGVLFGPVAKRLLRGRARHAVAGGVGRAAGLPDEGSQHTVQSQGPDHVPTPSAAAAASTAAPTPAATSSRRPSVLVVDDDKTARATLITILKRSSFDVTEAGTVAEAIGRLADRPDWVLLDLMLPDGSGCGVLRNVTDQGIPSRVCVISGAGPSMIGQARSLGARHVLGKPLDVPRLLGILAT